jgi:hypothetical protein
MVVLISYEPAGADPVSAYAAVAAAIAGSAIDVRRPRASLWLVETSASPAM